MDPKMAFEIARDGALFLSHIVLNRTGEFVYEFDHMTRKVSKKYNILRHCGCAWAMLDVYSDFQDDRIADAADKALKFLVRKRMVRFANGRVIKEEGYTKVGGNALAILALLRFHQIFGERKYMNYCEDLAYYIRYCTTEEGDIQCHKRSLQDNTCANFTSEYYPGEAVLAFAELWLHTKNEGYFDVAVKIAKFLRRNRDVGPNMVQDHWLLQGLEKLGTNDAVKSDVFLREYASSIAMDIRHNQTYMAEPRSAPIACRSEGLISYWQLTKDSSIVPFIERLLDIQATMQIKSGKDKGAFLRGLGSTKIRNDYTQHNISSFIRYWRAA